MHRTYLQQLVRHGLDRSFQFSDLVLLIVNPLVRLRLFVEVEHKIGIHYFAGAQFEGVS